MPRKYEGPGYQLTTHIEARTCRVFRARNLDAAKMVREHVKVQRKAIRELRDFSDAEIHYELRCEDGRKQSGTLFVR